MGGLYEELSPKPKTLKEWAADVSQGYVNFLKIHTSLIWLVDSAIEVALNLLEKITDVYVADITRCYKTIPLEGNDNLPNAIAHLVRIGYKQQKKYHPRSIPLIWIRVDQNGQGAKAVW